MNYNTGDKIIIDGKTYTFNGEYDNHYEIELNNKHGLMNKKTLHIVVEPIYDTIWFGYNKYYKICLNNKWGLIDKLTGKVLLNPEYDINNSYNDLVKIYEDLIIKSKMRIEKLRQLEEMV
jgi:hypothetical protein